MTDISFASPRLERPADAPFLGVCTALARTTGTDPVLWRVLAVVLTFFGGLGAVLYLAGIVAIPREGEQRSLADRLVHGPDRHVTGRQLIVLVLLVCGVVSLLGDTDGVVTAAVLAALVVLYLRGRGPVPAGAIPTGSVPTGSVPTGSVGVPPVGDPPAAYAPYTAAAMPAPAGTAMWAAPPPRPRRPRSPLTAVTAALAAVVAGILLLVGAFDGASVPTEVVLAAALVVVGLGIAAGAWWGPSWWLVALAAVLGVALAGTVAVRPALQAGVGSRLWEPAAAGSYRLGVGEATLDLRALPTGAAAPVDLSARVDVGHLVVVVPDGVAVSLDARSGLGNVQVLGVGADGQDVVRHADLGPSGPPQVRLDLSVRTGAVEVRRG